MNKPASISIIATLFFSVATFFLFHKLEIEKTEGWRIDVSGCKGNIINHTATYGMKPMQEVGSEGVLNWGPNTLLEANPSGLTVWKFENGVYFKGTIPMESNNAWWKCIVDDKKYTEISDDFLVFSQETVQSSGVIFMLFMLSTVGLILSIVGIWLFASYGPNALNL